MYKRKHMNANVNLLLDYIYIKVNFSMENIFHIFKFAQYSFLALLKCTLEQKYINEMNRIPVTGKYVLY